MAQVVYSSEVLDDLERLFGFFDDESAGAAAVDAIEGAINMLAFHPLIGRIVIQRQRRDLRELVISYGKTGYLALYRFLPAADEVRILGIRYQRELDYP